ncbi:MAG: hypothetical protein ABSC19_05035 [Syntrophorhabdales bacterium]|jgi:hypothetical protein
MSTALYSVGAGSYGPGTITIPATAVPSGFSQLVVSWECASWTDTGSQVAVTLEVSFDGGVTWQPWTTCVCHGGALNKQGIALTTQGMWAAAPQVGNCQVQGGIVITGSPLVTQGVTLAGE